MRIRTLAAIAAASLTLAAAPAMAQPQVMIVSNPTLGLIYADASGRTLYTWDRDTEANVSTCSGNCLVNWPPFVAEAAETAAGPWTIVVRSDGIRIWAYNGDPLYYFLNDTAAGQTNGNQPAGTWHVVAAPGR